MYSILSNEHLQLQNEDSLFSFIQKIFLNDDSDYDYDDEEEDNKDGDDISIISFYETIEFSSLSEEKFIEFLENFNSKRMTKLLWKKLYPCFYITHQQTPRQSTLVKIIKEETEEKNKERYLPKLRTFEFDGNEEHLSTDE